MNADQIPDIVRNTNPQQVLCDPVDGYVFIIHDSRKRSTIGSNSLVTVYTSNLEYLFHFTVSLGNMCGYTLKCCLSGYYFYYLFSDYILTQVSVFCKHTGNIITTLQVTQNREAISMDVDSTGALYILNVSYNLVDMLREDSLLICSNDSYHYQEFFITSKYLVQSKASRFNTVNHIVDFQINRDSLYLLFKNPKYTYMQELSLSGEHLRYFDFDNKLTGVSCFCVDPITRGLALICTNAMLERLFILSVSGAIVECLPLDPFKLRNIHTVSVALNLKTNQLILLNSCIHVKCLNEIITRYCWLKLIDCKLVNLLY